MTRITLQILDLGFDNKERYHATVDAKVPRAELDNMSDLDFIVNHMEPLLVSSKKEFYRQAKVYEKKHPSAEKSS